MSSGIKQIVQFAVETTVGTTPSTFARQTLPFTTCSMDATAKKTDSSTIKDSRIAGGQYITGIDYAGDLEVEVQYGAYDTLFEAVAFNSWTSNVLTFGGTTRKTISLLRGFTDIADYHIFSGCHINQFKLTVPEEGLVTATFSLMGMGRTKATAAPAGSITAALNNPLMSSLSLGTILIDGAEIAGACISQLDFTWDNSLMVQKCLGKGIGAILELVAKGTGSVTVAWSANTSALYEKQFLNTPIALSIPMTDSDGNKYVLALPKLQITSPLPSGGNSDILTTQFSFTVADTAPTLTRTPKSTTT
ncbi:MAG: phage tail tube protein [Acinetobacter sp.]